MSLQCSISARFQSMWVMPIEDQELLQAWEVKMSGKEWTCRLWKAHQRGDKINW